MDVQSKLLFVALHTEIRTERHMVLKIMKAEIVPVSYFNRMRGCLALQWEKCPCQMSILRTFFLLVLRTALKPCESKKRL